MAVILKSVSEKDSSLDQTLVGLLNFLLGPSVHPHCKNLVFSKNPAKQFTQHPPHPQNLIPLHI